jgi:Phosphofructokinase
VLFYVPRDVREERKKLQRGQLHLVVMSRAPVEPKRIIRTKTLEQLDIDINPFEDQQSKADLPKVVRGNDVQSIQSIRSPALKTFSKVLLSQDNKVQRPPHLSQWCKVGSFPSPLGINSNKYNRGLSFLAETETILVDIIASSNESTVSREFLRCGPRATLAFHPANQVKPCVVTCGGLCPGLNNVIREIVITLIKVYNVKGPISGIPYGFKGFYSTELDIIPLTLESVAGINHQGGSILGSSRGGFDCKRIFDAIEGYGFNMVIIIGGDGTHRAIDKLFQESRKRKACIAICGVTKSIDQDIPLIDRCFGFDSAG